MSKTIIPNADGTYGLTEWLPKPEYQRVKASESYNTAFLGGRIEVWEQELAAQPQVKVYQSKEGELNHEWCKSHAYKEIQDAEWDIGEFTVGLDFVEYVFPVTQPNHEAVKEEDIPKPIGSFILEQTDITPIMGVNGAYYYYGDVCTLLSRYKETLQPEPVKEDLWEDWAIPIETCKQALIGKTFYDTVHYYEALLTELEHNFSLTKKNN